MIRTSLFTAAAAIAALTAACSTSPAPDRGTAGPASTDHYGGAPVPADGTYTEGQIVEEVESWLGVSAETAAEIVETVFSDLGRPNGFIRGGESSGAIGVGLRYGEGDLQLYDGQARHVFWQGPSIGFDVGGNASRTLTLVYGMRYPDEIYRRYPGVEGTAYYVGGVGINYQRLDNVTLVPLRAGVGLRTGANVGYLAYTRERNILPF